MMQVPTVIIVLAAGNSSRLGRAKQLLDFDGQTLLQNVISEANHVDATKTFVVTGSEAETIENAIAENVIFVRNADWENGIGSSISAGMKRALEFFPNLHQAIIAVCDQPFVSAPLFANLISEAGVSVQNIIACSYAETVGTPVLFKKKYFPELLRLDGHKGAKPIVEANLADAKFVLFPKGEIDIDTQLDYEKLKNRP